MVAFALLLGAVEARWEPLWAVDRGVARALHDLAAEHTAPTAAVQVVSDLGGSATWWVVHAVTALHLLLRRLVRLAAFVAVTAAGGALLTATVKTVVARERPTWSEPVSTASGFAFPSGHTTGSAVGVGVLLLVLLPLLAPRWRRGAVVVGLLFAVAVGVSRIVLGVHWASDVLGGWLLSLAWVLAMAALFRVPLGSNGPGRAGRTQGLRGAVGVARGQSGPDSPRAAGASSSTHRCPQEPRPTARQPSEPREGLL